MVKRERWSQSELFPTPESKRCGRCRVIKPLADFHRRRAARDGRQSWCRVCSIAHAKRFHADNLELCRRRISAWMQRVDQENKRRVLEYLRDHPCVDCGEADPVVLEFDHQRDKVRGIAELLHAHVRWKVIAEEIAKCEVRCANCHRRRTATRGGWFRVAAETWAARGSNPEPTD
jgi:hypothetical protein